MLPTSRFPFFFWIRQCGPHSPLHSSQGVCKCQANDRAHSNDLVQVSQTSTSVHSYFTYKAQIWPSVMVSSCNPSTQGDEATGLWFCNQPGFHNDSLSKTKQNPQLLKMKLLAIPRWLEQGVTPNMGPFCLTPQNGLLDQFTSVHTQVLYSDFNMYIDTHRDTCICVYIIYYINYKY